MHQYHQRCQICKRSNEKCARHQLWKIFAPQKSRPKFTKFGSKCRLAGPLTVLNFVTLRLKCPRYLLSKICAPRTSGPELIKIRQYLLRTNALHCAKFHRARPNDVWEKRYKIILHSSAFWRLRWAPWAKVYQPWHWCTARPELPMCQISSSSDTCLRDICCRTSLISLKAWPTDRQNTVNDMSPHTTRRQ